MNLHFDANLGTVAIPGQEPIPLTRSERCALELLSSNPQRVFTRDQILDAISEPGSDKSDRNVDFLINRLRRKLSDDARRPRFIATRYGEGYVWIAGSPVSRSDIAGADFVVGPVLGLDLVGDSDASRSMASMIAQSLAEAFGAGKRVVYAPDCPPPEEFGATMPAHSAELTFFADRGRTDCVIALKEFRSGRIVAARRLGLGGVKPGQPELAELSREIVDSTWRSAITAPSRNDPLPIALYTAATGEDAPVEEPESAGSSRLLSVYGSQERRIFTQWRDNERRLRAQLARSPDDPELKLLIALNIQSKYVMTGVRLFAAGEANCEADEDEIEALVTAALPYVRSEPEYAIIAGKLLHFIQRGYDELARTLCESAYSESVSVGRSLAVIGQMRAFHGETDPAIQCIDQAIHLARPKSHAHLYALVLKCQALAAAGRWDALADARRHLSNANSLGGFVLEPLFADPVAPSMRARALPYLFTRRRAQATLQHKHYVGARLFHDPAHAANSLRGLVRVLTDRFGPDIVPGEVLSAHPEIRAA